MDDNTTHLGAQEIDSNAFQAILPVAGWEVSWHTVLKRIEIRRRVDPPDEPERWRPLTRHEATLMWNDCANVAYLPRMTSVESRPWRFGKLYRDDLIHAVAESNPRSGYEDVELSELAQGVYDAARQKPAGTYCTSVDQVAKSLGAKHTYEGKHRMPMKEAKEIGRALRLAGFEKVKKSIGGRTQKVWFKREAPGEPRAEVRSWTPRQRLSEGLRTAAGRSS